MQSSGLTLGRGRHHKCKLNRIHITLTNHHHHHHLSSTTTNTNCFSTLFLSRNFPIQEVAVNLPLVQRVNNCSLIFMSGKLISLFGKSFGFYCLVK
ncbi:hypothetical protein VNO78_22261 [Psophocarpus tetragonolobus]|uniref:Uncharacterized protein n=1 Tax=Psophocarpus tetragonolobus TaxID=3891 RepID=A0AAN9XJ09_PSOTE